MTLTRQGDRWQTHSPEETRELGDALGRALTGGLTVALVGPLGAGKTQLVKGIAVGNGIADASGVTSPTFTLVNEYPGKLKLFHLDAYRLSKPNDLLSLGFDEMVGADAAVVVEWADRVRCVMPEDTLWIELTITGETSRQAEFSAAGLASQSCLHAMAAPSR